MISLYAQINRPIGHLPFLSLSLFLSLFLSFIPFQLQIPGKSFSIRTNTKHSSINEKFVSKLFISTKNFSFPKRKICRRKRNNVIFVNVHRENGGIERKEGTLEARSRSITRETGKGIAEYGRIFPSLFCPRTSSHNWTRGCASENINLGLKKAMVPPGFRSFKN